MCKSVRALVLAVLVLVSTVTLGVASAFTAAFSLAAATAFIVPGTGTHNILDPIAQQYKENAATRFIHPVVSACDATCNLPGVDYPASFFPIPLPGWCPNLSCDTWNKSVGTGVTNLGDLVDTSQPVIVFGYSQGGAVVSHWMYSVPSNQQGNVTVVTIGNIENPLGLWSRLSFLPTIPLLDITFGPQLPTDGITSYNYSFEYDPVGDAPQYWGNPVTMLNALAAFQYVHGNYLVPNGTSTDALPYGYNDISLGDAIDDAMANCTVGPGSNCRKYEDATFILIPQQGTLPIYQPFVDLGTATGLSPFVQPFVDLASPVTKVVIDLGYDRTANPGIPRTLSILPFNPLQNPVPVAENFVQAGIQGVQAFVNDLGGLAPASTLAPTSPTPLSTLAKSQPDQSLTDSAPAAGLPNSILKLDAGDKSTNKATGQTTTTNTNAAKPRPLKALADLASNLPKVKLGNLFKPQTKQTKSPSEPTGSNAPGSNPPAGDNAGASQDAAA